MSSVRSMVAGLVAISILSARALAAVPSATAPATTRPVVGGFSDAGTFGLFVNESRVAVMRFVLSPDGALDNQTTLTIGQQSIAVSLKITPDPAASGSGSTSRHPWGRSKWSATETPSAS